jgi:beta-galactosidase
MSRKILPLNRDWKFAEDYSKEYTDTGFDDSGFENICIPHMCKETPYNYFDEKMYQFVSCYRKHFAADKDWQGKKVYIDFEGVMTYAKVYINGTYLGEHKGGYTPFSFDLSPYLIYDKENVITVMADSTERSDIPPFGFVIDYLTYGGIYREVNLRIVNALHIDNVFAKPVVSDEDYKSLTTEVFISNPAKANTDAEIKCELISGDGNIIASVSEKTAISGETQKESLEMAGLNDIKLWDIDDPNLYTVKVSLVTDGKEADSYTTRIGFRTAELTPQGFMLNGRNVKIMGLNRHQAFPYVGYAMPARAQRKDADILKYELGLNTVRTSHYPQSRHFLDRCDEIGLLVLEEIPGWQHIGDEAWQAVACENVREMIERDWNHPSIFLWGVRINESLDNHDFYVKTNEIAHSLDDTRQTGGIRYLTNSELLEDVYTMNDFVCGSDDPRSLRPQKEVTGKDLEVPYLVTEYNGHMYPTKRYDQEERMNEHTLRHYMVQNASMSDSSISGAIGWCAFDYNTHYQFGAGDRICYHGVMDMFRLPKFAAYAYKSQQNPEKEVVLEPVTVYARGERRIGGITPLTICTNCDHVELFIGDEMKGDYYPAKERFPGLSHAPVIVDELDGKWGNDWFDGKFIGYIGGEVAAVREFVKDPVLSEVRVRIDDTQLCSGEMDTTRLVFEAIDAAGNILPYTDAVVNVQISGPAKIIGPKSFALIGGCRAAWIKTTGQPGEVVVTAKCGELAEKIIKIEVSED